MKLIYIDNARIPTEKAHGIHIMKMCEAFGKAKINGELVCVELVVPKRLNGIKKDPFAYYEVEKVFKITKIPCVDLTFIWLNMFTFWLQEISFLVATKVYLVFKKFDFLYTREQLSGLFFKNYVVESHIYKDTYFYKKTWKKAAKIISITTFLRNKLLELGKREADILVAPDAVDFKKFNILISKEEARKKLNLPGDKILIGYVGMLKTMGVEKGVDVSIRSLLNLKENISLVLVGGMEDDILYYTDLAREIGVLERVVFIGNVPHSAVPLYLKSFDILIAPFPDAAHYKSCMSPLKLFEYMASGRPIIVTDLPSIREVLDEESAIFIKPNSHHDLGKAINNLVENKNLGEKIANQAHKLVQEKFTWEKRTSNILNFILT